MTTTEPILMPDFPDMVSSGCVPNLINLFVGFTDEATQVLRANGLDDLAARNRLEQLRGWRL